MSPDRQKQRDWYKVSVDTLRGWMIFLALLALAGGGYFGLQYWESRAIQRAAEEVIDEDGALIQQLRGEAGMDAFRTELNAAFADLETARGHFEERQFRSALQFGNRSRDVLRSLLNVSQRRSEAGAAQFIAVQGRVEFRRGERGDWLTARSRESLQPGDYVKTSGGGSAEIMFEDGTLYTVRPDTLFLVSGSAGGRSDRSIELQYGWINLNTAQTPSRVGTPQAQAHVEDDSEAVVAYDEARREGRFTTYQGAMEVASAAGETRRVEALQTVAQDNDKLSEPQPLPPAPFPLSPNENAEVDFDTVQELLLSWSAVDGADRYALQISRNRLFVDNVIDVEDRLSQQATLGVQGEGTFLWRVASIQAERQGPWSPPLRFRVASQKGLDDIDDDVPPEVFIDDVQAYGSIFIISGRTEAGASVWINAESVAVEADGAFTKTIQLAQAGWDFIEIRATDAWGNEVTERKRVYVESL